MKRGLMILTTLFLMSACTPAEEVELVLRGGTIYDGSGEEPFVGDVAIRGERILEIAPAGELNSQDPVRELDVSGLAVAPGFINVLSWATESLLVDGRSESDIRQGVTLEIFGEGWSMGPLNDAMREEALGRQGDLRYDIPWTTLGEYLDHLVENGPDDGIATNVASFVGATTVRIHELGYEDRPPTAEELERMKALVATAMEEGALGLGSSLIYPPAFYAETEELIELSKVVASYGGVYISHLRSEGDRLLEAIDELITIARDAQVPAEIYHLKAAGRDNWSKLDEAIARIEAARAEGLSVAANMYTYEAGATSLAAVLPPWVSEGGQQALLERLADPVLRTRIAAEMNTKSDAWENFYLAAGADGILLAGFKAEASKPLTGKTLGKVATDRGQSPEETAFDLLLANDAGVGAVFFLMSEDNVRRQITVPWISFGSDAASISPEGDFLKSNPHPRAYGNFARLLGRYVRDERLISLEEAVRRLTSMPAERLNLGRRGRLVEGYFADIAVFDPDTVNDPSTYADPHRLAEGFVHVLVNGTPVLEAGELTGARPGRVVRRADS